MHTKFCYDRVSMATCRKNNKKKLTENLEQMLRRRFCFSSNSKFSTNLIELINGKISSLSDWPNCHVICRVLTGHERNMFEPPLTRHYIIWMNHQFWWVIANFNFERFEMWRNWVKVADYRNFEMQLFRGIDEIPDCKLTQFYTYCAARAYFWHFRKLDIERGKTRIPEVCRINPFSI